jgi:histidinol-phosphate aminotransferase
MDLCELTPAYIRSIAPYQPGKPIEELERELGIKNAIKLASNENPLGPSPKALEAAREALHEIARYPDGNGFRLKAALAAHYGVKPESIVLGNGSNDVLELAARVFLAPGLGAVYSQHAFAVYPLVAQAIGAVGVEAPASNFGHDLEAMRRAIRPDTRVVFIANPNNPTGTFIGAAPLKSFIREVAPAVVVLDEAYNEYLPEHAQYESVSWLADHPNLIITRTFSKAYGLAGLRVGFALTNPGIADLMNRVRQPFNVSSVALAAARAALSDQEFVSRSVQLNADGMRQLEAGFEKLAVRYIPSLANFVSFEAPNANAVYERLLRAGVIVRPIASYGMPRHLRVSVGLEPENARFLQALEQALRDG